MNHTEPFIQHSNGNTFADLKLSEPDTHLFKAVIVAELHRLTKLRNLTQARAGVLMGIAHWQVSRLFRGDFRHYSLNRLVGFLTALRPDDVISSLGPGHISFQPAQRIRRDEVKAP